MTIALVLSTLAWAALEAHAAPREPHARLPREVATGIALLATHVAAIAEHGGDQPLGLVVIAAGVALRVWAIRSLGGDFVSTTSAPVRVVRSGPYRWLRHPSELGLLAAATGAAILLASPIAAAIVALVLAPLVVARCAAEDRAWAR